MASIYEVTLDESLRALFHNLNGIVKLCDESGEVVAHVVPTSIPLELLQGLRMCPHSEKELELQRQETGGRSLSEILQDLEKLA